jgi:hypothetical protein
MSSIITVHGHNDMEPTNIKLSLRGLKKNKAGFCEESFRKVQVLSAVIERSLSRGHCDPAGTACCAFILQSFVNSFFYLFLFHR